MSDFIDTIHEFARVFSVPDHFLAGWVDSIVDMPLVKFRLYVEGQNPN